MNRIKFFTSYNISKQITDYEGKPDENLIGTNPEIFNNPNRCNRILTNGYNKDHTRDFWD